MRPRDDIGPARFDVDRTWLMRGIAIAVAIGLLLLIVKISMMAFGGVGKRLDRADPGGERAAVSNASRFAGDAR